MADLSEKPAPGRSASLRDITPVQHLQREWADYTHQRLKNQLKVRKVKKSGQTQREIRFRNLIQGDTIVSRFEFPYHARFPDMGVGNGVSVASRSSYAAAAAGAGKRKKKPWLNKPFFGRYYWLAEAVPTQFVERITEKMDDTLTQHIQDGDN